MFYYQTCLNTLPELGVVFNFSVEAAVSLCSSVVSLVVLKAVVPLLLLTAIVVLFWSVVVILPCDNVCDCEDVVVRWILVWGDVLFVGGVSFKAVLWELVTMVARVDKDAVLDGWCVSVVTSLPTVVVVVVRRAVVPCWTVVVGWAVVPVPVRHCSALSWAEIRVNDAAVIAVSNV